jgi:hypothetical protein
MNLAKGNLKSETGFVERRSEIAILARGMDHQLGA